MVPLVLVASVSLLNDDVADVKARRTEVPAMVLAVGTLAGANYMCAFEIAGLPPGSRSAEDWLRSIIEDAPRPMQWLIVTGWTTALRLRLGPRPSPDHVLGWKILSSSPTEIVIGVEGAALSAQQLVQVQADRVLHATFVRYERPVARALWGIAAPIHVRSIPYLMERAARPPGNSSVR
jgi:hypothetical protein